MNASEVARGIEYLLAERGFRVSFEGAQAFVVEVDGREFRVIVQDLRGES